MTRRKFEEVPVALRRHGRHVRSHRGIRYHDSSEHVLSGMNGALAWAKSQEAAIKDVTPIKEFLFVAAEAGDAGRQVSAVLAQWRSARPRTEQCERWAAGKLGER